MAEAALAVFQTALHAVRPEPVGCKNMIKFIIILVIGAGIGALMGHFGKCHDGGCPLTANPVRGAIWGVCLAALAAYPLLMNALRKPVPESENIVHPQSAEELKAADKEKSRVVLVDFYADWCGPCRGLAPTINKLADDYKGRTEVMKVNIDQQAPLANQYGVQSIPTVVILKDGTEVNRFVGVQPYETYSAALDSALK